MKILESQSELHCSGRAGPARRIMLSLLVPAFAVSAGLSISTLAVAQAEDEVEDGMVLEEVIVTATRRELNLQKTAISIQAITESDLRAIGAVDLDEIVAFVPGLVKTGEDYTIRGLRSQLGNRNGSTGTTSRYLDEVPIEHNFRLFDMARVEVLKGPQGSWYGAGAMGGVIRMVTNKPNSREFYGIVDLDYSSTSGSGSDNYELNAAINMPLVEDKLAVRAVLYQQDYDGFIDDIRLGINDINAEKVTGGRFALRWDVTDTLAITATYLREEVEAFGNSDFEDLNLGPYQTAGYFEAKSNTDVGVGNLLLDWDLGWSNLVLSLTKTKEENTGREDITSFINGAFGLPDPPSGGFATVYQLDDITKENDVAELRLVSSMDSAWDWVVGAFYQDSEFTFADTSVFVTEVDPDNPAIGIRVGDLSGFDDPDMLLDQRAILGTERETAVFGELSYHFTDKLYVTGGIRYLDVEQRNQTFVVSTLFGFPPGVGDPLDLVAVDHSDYYTKFRVAYEFTEDVGVFFIRSEGFRRGGFNLASAIGASFGIPNIPEAYNSDEVTNWELGLHSQWLDNTLLLNGAVYYMDWTDIRVNVARPSGINYTTNGPAADIYGLELELQYNPIENFDIFATAALTSAELSAEEVDPVLEEIGVPYPQNLTLAPKGEDLPGIPKQTYSLTLNYRIPELIGTFAGYARLDTVYTSGTYNTYEQGPFSQLRVRMDAYTIMNLRLGLVKESWNVSVYVKNLTDTRADLFIDQASLGPQRALRNRPRTIGLNLRKTF